MTDRDTLDLIAGWSDTMRAAREERDELIRMAHDEGWSLRDIADAADLSHAGVAKIVARGADE